MSNTVRLFISSDLSGTCIGNRYLRRDCSEVLFVFQDTQIELAALRKQVYPALRSRANSLGLQLHIIDPFHYIESCNRAGNSNEDNGGGEGGVEESLLPYKLEEEGVFHLMVKEIQLCHRFSAGTVYVVSKIEPSKLSILTNVTVCIDTLVATIWS